MNKLIKLLTISLLIISSNIFAQNKSEPYQTIDPAQPVITGDKIEVRELFWYGCPHCYKLEESINEWRKNIPEGAEFVRMPAVFSKLWEQHAKIYYALEALGKLDELHEKVFYTFHVEKNKLATDEAFVEFCKQNGIDGELAEQTINSFAVNTKISAARAQMPKYGVNGVPAVIIDGKYKTNVQSAGGESGLFTVINSLIKKAQSER